MIGAFRDAGILCIPTVGAVKHAEKMVALGCEMITVQGGEGGGHTGAVPTTVLLPQVLDAVTVPVVASGGAGGPEHMAAALSEGRADAVLAASIFHFGTYSIRQVKDYLAAAGLPMRPIRDRTETNHV